MFMCRLAYERIEMHDEGDHLVLAALSGYKGSAKSLMVAHEGGFDLPLFIAQTGEIVFDYCDDLIADQVRQGVADRTGQLADDDLRLGTQMILRAFDQCLTRPQ